MEPLIEEQIIKAMGSIGHKLDTLSSSVADLDKKVDLHIQGMQYELKEYNAILDEHHKRSDAIQKDVELRDRMVQAELAKMNIKLKRALIPIDVIQRSKRWLLWTGGIAAAAVAIIQLIQMLKR